jgi:hypothetical protein
MTDQPSKNRPGKVASSNRRRDSATSDPIATHPRKSRMKKGEGLQDLNFKVHKDLHRAIKVAASLLGMSMKEFLAVMYGSWLKHDCDDETMPPLPPI